MSTLHWLFFKLTKPDWFSSIWGIFQTGVLVILGIDITALLIFINPVNWLGNSAVLYLL